MNISDLYGTTDGVTIRAHNQGDTVTYGEFPISFLCHNSRFIKDRLRQNGFALTRDRPGSARATQSIIRRLCDTSGLDC